MQSIMFPEPFEIEDKLIKGATYHSLGFKRFAALASEAREAMNPGEKFASAFQRARICAQCRFIQHDDTELEIRTDMLTLVPARAAMMLPDLINQDEEGGRPAILNKGDGFSTPIHIKLGTPMQGGGTEVAELEFQAQWFSDVEDIMSADSMTDQTVALIEKCGRPIGVNVLALPEWAVDQITITDGSFIMNQVLPSFLEPADVSTPSPPDTSTTPPDPAPPSSEASASDSSVSE